MPAPSRSRPPTGSSPSCSARSTGAARRIDESPVSPAQAAELLELVADGTISGTIAKQVFEIMLETGEGAAEIVESRGLKQTSDTGAIDAEIDKILAANADKVAEYKAGKQQLFGFFVGQTMKAMAGKANPQVVNERLRAKLGAPERIRMREVSYWPRLLRAPCRLRNRPPPGSPAPPKLLVVLSVDQFSADLWDEYRPQFTGGFARLASGTVFHNGYQSHAATETCPGHSTLLTGDRPAATGIISNIWLNQSLTRSDKSVYCAENEMRPAPLRPHTRSPTGTCACRRSAIA